MPRPWLLKGEREPLDFYVFKLRQLTVADPRDGTEHPRFVLEGADWVNVIALTPDEQVVLIRQFRFGTWTETLEIPGGMVDPGEDPAVAAARELEEETGYRPASLELIGVSHPNPAIQGNRLHSYLARGCVQAHRGNPDEGEDIAVELYPRAALGELVREGKITHSLVLAALFFESQRAR